MYNNYNTWSLTSSWEGGLKKKTTSGERLTLAIKNPRLDNKAEKLLQDLLPYLLYIISTCKHPIQSLNWMENHGH